MITVRRAGERGQENYGWLDTRHTFSFGEYYDAGRMGFRTLRVINEDRVRPESGFGQHSHRDMEIVSYVIASWRTRTAWEPARSFGLATCKG